MTRIRLRRGTASDWSAVNPILLEGEPGLETDTGKLKFGDGSTAWNSLAYYAVVVADHATEHEVGGGDELTGDLNANARVGVRKNSTGSTYERRRINLIEGSNVTLTVADDSGDEEVDVTIASTGGGSAAAGISELIYRYTVTGSDKTSIDTGVDTADAGSTDWTGGDLLEVFVYLRTDETAVASSVNLNVNNDTGANYDRQRVRGANATASANQSLGDTKLQIIGTGASAGSNIFATAHITAANYAGTVGNKAMDAVLSVPDSSTGALIDIWAFGWRSTSAITRLAITPATAGKKLKVGSQLLIYKRTSS